MAVLHHVVVERNNGAGDETGIAPTTIETHAYYFTERYINTDTQAN